MSLAVLADHMASKGRGGDSMLIHMAPQEVAGLQALAMAHGGSLTINPDTGLPEALSLKKLLPAIIGFGITAMTGIPAWQVGLGVGAVETARTGDLGRGISAGLGAYGGAGLGASFTAAPVAEMAGSQIASQAVEQAALEGIQLPSNYAEMAARTATPDQLMAARDSMSFGDLASKGATNFTNDPSKFATKDNFKYAAAAAAPILADQAVKSSMPQTVTKPGAIRPYSYDPYGGGFTAYPEYEVPKKAAEGGLMGMNNGGYNPGQLDFTQSSEPVVRMAGGGVPGYAGGALVNDQQIFDYFKTPGLTDAKIAEDMQKFQVSSADIARATGTQGQEADYNTRFVKSVALPGTDTTEFMNAANAVGLQNQDLATALQNSGLSAASQYALTHQNIGSDLNTAETQGGLEGLSSNINFALAQNKLTGDAGIAAAQAEMNKYGLNEADVLRATGKTLAELFPKALTCGAGMQLNAAGTACEKIPPLTCPTGYVPNADGTACVKAPPEKLTCGEGMELNAAGTACVPKKANTLTCDEGYEPNAAGTACVKKTAVPPTTQTLTCEKGFHKSIDGLSCIKDEPITVVHDCPSGYHWDVATQACAVNINATQTTTTTVDKPTDIAVADDSALPVGVSGAGVTTINPNGTITTRPDIPNIPDGGFTGMESLRKAYTDGGGSLGYIPYAPKTLAEFKTKYEDKLTGGSKAAYDYLTGKTPYSPTPYTPTGQIFKPYSEAMGIPQDMTKRLYIFDPVTKTYKRNPDYKPPAYATAGTAAAKGDTVATGSTDLTDQSKPPTTDPGPGNEWLWDYNSKKWIASEIQKAANGGLMAMARGGMAQQFDLGGYSDGGRLLRGPGDGVSDSIPATIGNKRPARLADGEFVVPARIVSELGNGSTEAGARKLYAMMDRVQAARRGSVGKGKVAKNSRADKYLPA